MDFRTGAAIFFVIWFITAFLVAGCPWGLALALVLAGPLTACAASFGGSLLMAAFETRWDKFFLDHFVDAFQIMLVFTFGMATTSIYPASVLLAAIAMSAATIRPFVEWKSRRHLSRWSGIKVGVFIGIAFAALIAISGLIFPTNFLNLGSGGLWMVNAVLDGLLVVMISSRIVIVLVGAAVGFVFAGIGALSLRLQPPSDQILTEQFASHRPDLEKIAAMALEDHQMTRIADDFVRPEGGISRERWAEYQAKFHYAGVTSGIGRAKDSCDIELTVWSVGLFFAGTSVSYVYCGPKSESCSYFEPPCRQQREEGSGVEDFGNYRFKKLTDNWFIYQESN